MNITIPRIFTTFEVAKICRVYPTTVINWVNKGKLTAHTTPGGHRRITAADLVDFMHRFDMPIPADLAVRAKSVLVVEDDPAFQHVLKRSLETLPGVEVSAKLAGLEALISIGKEPPDLVVLDINIPQMDGVKVCEVLKAGELTQFIKVVAITGEVLAPEQREFLAAHSDGFLQKPFPLGDLQSLVAGLLELEASSVGTTV